jgi:DNA-binding SARP family transcriptional activator
LRSRGEAVCWPITQKSGGGPTSPFTLRLLGTPSVSTGDGGTGAHLGTKELSLLAFLAIEPGAHSREELAALLWGESSDADARASLRQALKHLRDALGDAVVVERGRAMLAPDFPSDVADFRRAARESPADAIRFDVPHALAGLSVRHAPAFDEWLERTRAELRREYEEALATVGREALGRHAWREALSVADRWLAADPLSEPAIRLAVEATYLSGDRRAALARFADYRRLLERETGVAPGHALLSLIRRVESDAALDAPTAPADDWYARPPALQATLIERDAEWRALGGAWRVLGPSSGAILLVEGEAGAGKTRLAEEFLRWVVAEGGAVLRGRGYGGRAGVSYGTMVEVLRESLDQPGVGGTAPDWLTEVARLVPEIRQRFPGLPSPSPGSDPMHGSRLYEGVAQMLLAISAERPVVVAVDDLQWCDEDSCSLLLFLARRLERAPILWLGLLTLGELERDAPAARLCRVWRTRPHAGAVTLAPLSAEGVLSLVTEMGRLGDGPEVRHFAGRLHEVTRGNPFYLQELLKTLFAQEVLRDSPAGWMLPEAQSPGVLDVSMPRSVQDAIAERVERLPEPAHAMLVTVAVAETGCDTEVLSHMHGISRLHAAALGDALVGRRLLVEEENAYRCAHPVIGRVVRDGLSPSRRREVHRSLALTLQGLSRDSGDAALAGIIALHADRGGERGLAYQAALAASRVAAERFTPEEALSWLDQAATYARTPEEAAEVNRLTALLVDETAPVLGTR